MNNYAPVDLAFDRGEGCYLYTTDDQSYLDAVGGIAVCVLGHAHKQLAQAIQDQAETLIHTSNLYHIPLQEQLGAEITELANMEKVFFCNSGAEANEAAIKLTRLYGHSKNISVPRVIVMQGGFHGRTMATLTATGNDKVKQGFEPLVDGFVELPYNDLDAVKSALAADESICAIMLEPIQGEGGINIPSENYLSEIRKLCDEHECLMIMDEVQTGMCRTGAWFAHQHENIVPDIMTLAKAMANGMPIGACLVAKRATDLFQPGSHGSTFGGNPLASRAALEVIKILKSLNASELAKQKGAWLLEQFKTSLADIAGVKSIRGKGMMIGIELNEPCAELVAKAMEKHCLINVTAGNVIRLLPPLIMEQTELEKLHQVIVEIVTDFCKENKA